MGNSDKSNAPFLLGLSNFLGCIATSVSTLVEILFLESV
jgi:hypothetical protein